MKTLYWDLDGVIRDLHGVTVPDPNLWWSKNKDGKDVVEMVDDNLELLYLAQPTMYYSIAKKMNKIHVLSSQKDSWRPNTIKWLDKYLGNKYTISFLKPKEKLEYLGENDVLIEDYPLFEDYSKIILIDRLYNRNIEGQAPIARITNPIQLEDVLINLGVICS